MSEIKLPKFAITQIGTADTKRPRIIGFMEKPEVIHKGYREATKEEFEYHLEQIAKSHGLEVQKSEPKKEVKKEPKKEAKSEEE